MSAPPRISVVVPSFNQGPFLEDCLSSIFGQEYPDLEVLVYDGGSTDNSVDIIRRYSPRLAFWRSEKDGGQASAINEGMRRSTGQILCWLNSDDMYMPGAFAYAAARLQPVDVPRLVFGDCLHFVEGASDTRGSDVAREHATRRLAFADYIIQPSTFWTRRAWETTGELDATMNYLFDWDWFVRAQKGGVEFLSATRYLSIYRSHAAHKTGTGGSRRAAEMAALYRRQTSEKIGELFARCSQRRQQIFSARLWLRRFRLTRLEILAIKCLFPRIFFGHADRDIEDVLSML